MLGSQWEGRDFKPNYLFTFYIITLKNHEVDVEIKRNKTNEN
jgi:hypothetical protein